MSNVTIIKKVAILNSGSPEMEVVKFTSQGVVCRWFNGKNYEQHCFKKEMLFIVS
jgi:uncharacterized protein YodC (DUF2158 family)